MIRYTFIFLFVWSAGFSQNSDSDISLRDYYCDNYVHIKKPLDVSRIHSVLPLVNICVPDILLPDYTKVCVPEELADPFYQCYYEYKDGKIVATYIHYKPSYYHEFHNIGKGKIIDDKSDN